MQNATTPQRPESEAPDAARQLFETERLPFPPIPAHLLQGLRQHSPTLFSTRPLQVGPYDLEQYLQEVETRPDLAGYAIVGFDGHGINSWAAHCYVVDAGLAFFIQLPWGGAYLEPGPARSEIADVFSWAAIVQDKVALAMREQLIPAQRRLEVAASRFSYAGWRWLDAGVDIASVPWRPAAGMKAALVRELDDILARRHAP